MKTLNKIISFFIIITLIVPLLADARAGARGGRSGGGSHSFGRDRSSGFGGGQSSGFGSFRNQGGYQSPPYHYRPQPAYAAPSMRSPSTFGSFFSGLTSGLLGAWLYNKLFHSESTSPASSATQNAEKPSTDQSTQSATPQKTEANATKEATNQGTPAPAKQQGGFLHIILLLAIVYLIWRLLKKRRKDNPYPDETKQFSSQGDSLPQHMNLNDFINLPKSNVPNQSPVSEADQRVFEDILIRIQEAWSRYDLADLKRFTTPEMLEYFSQIIRENQQQGITNVISQLKLSNQEVLDSWQEGNVMFARVALTWRAIDYSINKSLPSNDPGYLLDGNMNEPVVVTEVWTFRKDDKGWLLGEIQQ
jgi:predicted lipid-binding transport protein (Tim44 family)